MIKIVAILFTALIFLGCSSKGSDDQSSEPKLVVNRSLMGLTLKDQNEKTYSLQTGTKKIIFAFSKDVGHGCNDFFATKDASYLERNHAIFIADISGAPSLIRSMFIIPGLKDFKHRVLILDDKDIAESYSATQDVEKITLVNVENGIIKSIAKVNSVAELAKILQN